MKIIPQNERIKDELIEHRGDSYKRIEYKDGQIIWQPLTYDGEGGEEELEKEYQEFIKPNWAYNKGIVREGTHFVIKDKNGVVKGPYKAAYILNGHKDRVNRKIVYVDEEWRQLIIPFLWASSVTIKKKSHEKVHTQTNRRRSKTSK